MTMTMLEKAARAHDRETAAQMGEPDPWENQDGIDFPAFREESLTAMRLALEAIRMPSMAQLAAAQMAWLNDPEKKSSTIYTAMIDAILE